MTAPQIVRVQEARYQLSPLGFHGWADLYWQEYDELSSDTRESAVACLLLCRAIELEFKAWHRQAGRADGLIDRFRHDLMASYWALRKKHQVLSANEVSVLQKANSFYLRQGFENAEMCVAGMEIPADAGVGGLRAVVQKIMGHGDHLNLKWW